MRLRKQRDDVKWLGEWIDGPCQCDTCKRFREVVRRYRNLYLMAEEAFKMNSGNGLIFPDEWTLKEKRVLKDAGLDK